ncbi:MAG: hypothetical protein HY646_19785 [Acidobacteria bacterium]|nr:hypothetical protein [Acidobacteriota bacterium]
MRNVCLSILFILCFSGRLAAQGTRDLILPVALNGYIAAPVHYQTTIRIVNMSSGNTEVTLEAYQNDGRPTRILELFPIARDGTKTVFQIPAGGSVEAFTAEDVPELNGWIRLTFAESTAIAASTEVAVINAPVGPHPICIRPSSEILTSVQTPAVSASTKFSAFAVIRPHRKSGYAIVNPSTTRSATVFLSLMDFSGRFVASATVEVPPQARVSRFVNELMPNAPSDFMGSLRITSTIPVGFAGVNVLFPEGEFTGINVVSPPAAVCIQVITQACNPLTSECRDFPTPCDVPDGWVVRSQ